MKIKQSLMCIAMAGAVVLTGCSSGQTESSDGGKTVVTMMYTTELPHLEEFIETKYPDIDLQIERNTPATLDGEITRRLRNGHGCDIVTSTLATGDVLNYLADLSADEYVSAYQSGIMHKTAVNGKNLFIPLPAQYYGYIYNVTLAKQNGLSVPTTQDELLEMLDKAKQKNIGTGENGADFAVDGTEQETAVFALASVVPDFFGQADGIQWTDGLKDGTSKFSGKMEMCLDLPLEMIEKGYMDSMPFLPDTNAVPILEKMSNGEMFMAFSSVSMLDNIKAISDYEFDMLPIFSDKGNPAWTISSPSAFLGINRTLTEKGNETKLDACRKILSLISTPEGQDVFMKDNGAAYSYLVDYQPADDIVPAGIQDCIENGYNFNLSISADFMRYFGSRCNSVLCGKSEIEPAFAELDAYFQDGDSQNGSLLGTIGQDMIVQNYNVRLQETEIGNLVSDAIREIVGVDIAVANGGSIRSSLYKGDIYSYDLDAVLPYDNKIIVLEVNADVIRSMLENGISAIISDNNIPGGRFLNVSGLKYSFTAPTEETPAQLVEVTLPDGSPLDENAAYTIAVTNYMAGVNGYFDNNGDGYTMLNVYSDDVPKDENVKLVRETDLTFKSVLEDYIVSHNDEEISSKVEGRIISVNQND